MNNATCFVVLDNLKTYYRIYNQDKKETVILLHAIFGDGTIFRKHVDILSTKYRVIVPDLPGFGKSEKPRRVTHSYLARWFDEFAEKLEIDYGKTFVYGLSLGGICLAETKHFNEFKKLIFESSPFSSDQLITHELVYFKILVSVIPHHTLKKLYEKNQLFRNVIVWLYKLTRPKPKETFPDEVLDKYDDKVDLETVYEVAGDLSKLDVKFPENANYENVVLIYDRGDPTVSFESIQNYFIGKSCKFIVTNYGVHAPTTYPNKVKEVLYRLNESFQ